MLKPCAILTWKKDACVTTPSCATVASKAGKALLHFAGVRDLVFGIYVQLSFFG